MGIGPLEGIKAVVFDVFGTVVDWRTGVSREAAAFLARHKLHGISADDFADSWRSHYAPAMEEVRSGRRPFVRLDILHRENLEKALEQSGLDPAAFPQSDLDELNLAWHRLDPWPDSVPGILRLKQRFIVAPLSNGNIRLMIDMARRSGLPWDAILGAEVAGAYKPAPEAYLKTADILGLNPQEICLAAAHNNDLAAARACGFRTAFILRATEHGTEQKSDLSAEQAWDIVAGNIGDLAARLGT